MIFAGLLILAQGLASTNEPPIVTHDGPNFVFSCDRPHNTAEMEICDTSGEAREVISQLRAAEVELGSAYDSALKAIQDSSKAPEQDEVAGILQREQAAWTSYRDLQCERVGLTMAGVLGRGFLIANCELQLTKSRIEELKQVSGRG